MIKSESIVDGVKIIEYDNGTIVKSLITQEVETHVEVYPTLEDKINYLYYKQMGVI